MSTDRKRLSSAIQRIAREDPAIRDIIADYKNRGGIGSASATVAGAEDGRQICCDGSTSDNANPGADTRDPSESAKDGLDPDDPADISDNLTGVVDCATGQPICFEGSDWIPNPDPTYEEGVWYRAGTKSCFGDSVYYNVKTVGQGQSIACAAASTCDGGLNCPSSESFTWACQAEDFCGGGGGSAGSLRKKFCDDEYLDEFCSEAAENPDLYTESDGCVNLSIKGGSIVGTKNDPDNDGSYYSPRKEIELCDGQGSRVLIRASSGGGWKSIKSLDGDIDPDTQSGYLYRPDGQKVRQISQSEFRDDTV